MHNRSSPIPTSILTDVGIGTSTPEARLHVVGDSKLVGTVGVNTTTPLARLHVKDTAGVTAIFEGTTVAGVGIEFRNSTPVPNNWQIRAEDGEFTIKKGTTANSILSLVASAAT